MTKEANPEAADLIALAAQQDPQAAAMAAQSPQAQQEIQSAMMAAQAQYTVKVKRTRQVGKPVIENVQPENVVVKSSHKTPYLYDCLFVAHEFIETQSDLIALGYDPDIVTALPDYHGSIQDSARNRGGDDTTYSSEHESTRQIQGYDCYANIDFDGDGIAERRKIVISNGHLLANDEWNDSPMVGGATQIMPHKYQGVSQFERMRPIQDSKTPVIRSIIEGTQLSSNPRTGVVTGEVNLDDLLTSRTGGIVRAKTQNGVFALPTAEVPMSSYSMLDYMDKQRKDRGGAAVDAAGQATKMVGRGGDFSMDRVMSSMEQGNALLARTLGETFLRGIFIQLHNLLRENHTGEISARVGGRWLRSTPSEWRSRPNVSIQLGASVTERARQAAVLKEGVAFQQTLAQSGSVMFDEAKTYSMMMDYYKLSGIRNPEKYYVDPDSPEGQQKYQQQAEQRKVEKAKQDKTKDIVIKANMQMAEAELIKGRADVMGQQVKNQNEKLKMQLERVKDANKQFADGVKAAMDQDNAKDQLALDLTKLEVENGRELSDIFEENRSQL